MLIGPIVARELITAARQPRMYRRRSSLAILMLVLVGLGYGALHLRHHGALSIAAFRIIISSMFVGLVFFQYVICSELVPVYVAGLIAGERERRTIGDLLTTRLSSAEIVLGKLTAGLAQLATTFALGVPALVLMPLFCGFDPSIVALACLGMASTAYFVGGLSILVSIGCRRNGRAIATALTLMFAWLIIPLLIMGFMPRTMPQLVQWVNPVNRWLLASSPAGVFSLSAIAALWGGTIHDASRWIWMIGLQIAAGTVLIGWAIARLRPVARKLEDGEGGDSARLRARHRWRITARPACGKWPVLWKELHTGKPGGLSQVAELLVLLMIFASIIYGAYYFGWPALREAIEHGFHSTANDVHRLAFNNYLRCITSVVELVCLLAVAGAAADTVAVERARATWDSLLSTSLTGPEILGAKLIGAVWQVRGGIVLMLALSLAGMLAGSIHPIGFVAAIALLIASISFIAALGVHASLVARDVTHATARIILLIIWLTGAFSICYLPTRMTSVAMGASSVPFVNWLCLVSYRDVSEAMGEGVFNYLSTMAIFTNEGPGRVVSTWILAVAGYTAAAAWLTIRAWNRFDRIAGRPEPTAKRDSDRPDARRNIRRTRAAEVRETVHAG
jgi:ABC-type Na+ efflux pump permease subunit